MACPDSPRTTRLSLLLVLITIAVAACGGGGGGGGGGPPPPPPLTLSLSTNAVTFATATPDTIAPSGVSVTATVAGTASGTLYVVVTPSNAAIATVTNINIGGGNSGTGTVVPGSPMTLGPGSHTATITVRACLNDPTCATGQIGGSPQTIAVTYNIAGIASSAANLAFSIGNAPVAADLSKSFNLTGHGAPSWTATTNVPWLGVAPATGGAAAPTSVAASLTQTAIDALENGSYNGTISVSASNGQTVAIPVVLTLARTRVNYVAPYIARAGIAEEVIIRGENFSLITPTGVSFGGSAATVFNVVSNTEIRATHPALVAGPHDVAVANNQGVTFSRAQLVVVDPVDYAFGALEYPGGSGVSPTDLVYDAERRALLVGFIRLNGGGSRIARYAYAATAWSAPVDTQLSGAIGLTTNGRKLLVGYDVPTGISLAELDPATLAQTNVTTRSPSILRAQTIDVANDGRAIIVTAVPTGGSSFPILSYDPLTRVLAPIDAGPYGSLQQLQMGGSEDGATVLVGSNDSNRVPPSPFLRYDSQFGAFVDTQRRIRVFDAMVLDRRGTRVIVLGEAGYEVYEAQSPYALLGTLPNGTSGAIFSPVAQRVYVYDRNAMNVRVFDSAAQPSGGAYPEILPAVTLAQAPDSGAGAIRMAITPEGDTLFIAGHDRIVAVPLP